VQEIQADHNAGLKVEGIVVNQFQPRASLPQQLVQELIDEGLPVLQPYLSADYPAAVPAESKAIWGGAASAQRLYAVTQFLVWMCDHPYAAKVVARRQCAQDLDWLKLQFFDENMRFDWPQVTLATIVRKQRVPAALIKRLTPSDELAVIVGKEPLPRTEVVSRLWAYIKKNKLQDAVNKRMINADPNLKKIFGKNQVSLFELAGLSGRHLR
jgi:hypothetical protein